MLSFCFINAFDFSVQVLKVVMILCGNLGSISILCVKLEKVMCHFITHLESMLLGFIGW